MMRKIVLVLVILAVAGVAGAVNPPTGMTGLWKFNDGANLGKATVGTDLTTNAYATGGPDGGALNTWAGTWATVTGGLTANGGGVGWNPDTWVEDPAGIYFVNEYSVAMDILLPGAPTWRALLQTADTPNGNDADLWIGSDGSIGLGANYSAAGAVPGDTWKRVVFAADLGNYFRVFVDGTPVVDLSADDIGIDGRLSLYDYSVSFFSDDNWEDGPVICDTLAYWNRTLTDAEVAALGDTSSAIVPEPATLSILALGGLALLRRSRR